MDTDLFGYPEISTSIKPRSLSIIPVGVDAVKKYIEANHYSGSINGVKVDQCFMVTHKNLIVGAVLFGQMSTTAWKKFAKRESEVLELRRLVLADECGRNSESYVIGKCLKWIKKNLPVVSIIVSYADPEHGHTGVIYKASNFDFIGCSPPDKVYRDLNGKIYHSRAMRTKYKNDYKPFVKELRAKLKRGELKEEKVSGKYCFVYRIRKIKTPLEQNEPG